MLNKKKIVLFAFVSMLALGAAIVPVFASGDHKETTSASHDDHAETGGDEHGAEAKSENHDEEGKTVIDPQAAADMKISVADAGAAIIQSSIPVTGKISLNRNAMAEVKGRFAGVVRSVGKTQGESVKEGETLATVEANDSLQVYAIKSPIGGVVLARNTNIGHIAGDEPLFVIANLSSLWGEFHIFPRDMMSINGGEKIRIKAVGGDMTSDTTISSLLPLTESASQTVIARAEISNKEGKWRPGMSVHGDIFTTEKSVPVAVKLSAIQRIEGKPVIFVEKDGIYETRNVVLGLQDSTWVEVTEGLQVGEKYVAEGSFVVKAQVGKAGAEHAH